MHVYLGADLGGTNFRVGLRRAGEAALLDQESVPSDPAWDGEALLEHLVRMLDRLRTRRPETEVVAIGFGSTGDIDPAAGVCYSMKRFPALEAAPLRDLLVGRFNRPAAILNDGLCAALGELRAGAGRGLSDFVMITLGTGIGGGVVLGGRLVTGAAGRVGKAGHQIVALYAPGPILCHCGLRGCWQSLAAQEAVLARARDLGVVVGEPADLVHLIRIAGAGDLAAGRVMEETGRYVGIGLANLVKVFAPQRLIVGGGLAENNPILLAAAQAAVDAYAIKPYQYVPVVSAALGKSAGLLGATWLAEEAAADRGDG